MALGRALAKTSEQWNRDLLQQFVGTLKPTDIVSFYRARGWNNERIVRLLAPGLSVPLWTPIPEAWAMAGILSDISCEVPALVQYANLLEDRFVGTVAEAARVQICGQIIFRGIMQDLKYDGWALLLPILATIGSLLNDADYDTIFGEKIPINVVLLDSWVGSGTTAARAIGQLTPTEKDVSISRLMKSDNFVELLRASCQLRPTIYSWNAIEGLTRSMHPASVSSGLAFDLGSQRRLDLRHLCTDRLNSFASGLLISGYSGPELLNLDFIPSVHMIVEASFINYVSIAKGLPTNYRDLAGLRQLDGILFLMAGLGGNIEYCEEVLRSMNLLRVDYASALPFFSADVVRRLLPIWLSRDDHLCIRIGGTSGKTKIDSTSLPLLAPYIYCINCNGKEVTDLLTVKRINPKVELQFPGAVLDSYAYRPDLPLPLIMELLPPRTGFIKNDPSALWHHRPALARLYS